MGKSTRGTSACIFSPCATNTVRCIVSTSTRIHSQIRVDVPQDLRWQTEVFTIRADKSLPVFVASRLQVNLPVFVATAFFITSHRSAETRFLPVIRTQKVTY